MENNEQSFIAQGAKTSLSHGLTPQIPKALVSKTLHQYFSPSKASVSPQKPSPQKPSESYQEQTAQKADALVQLHADTTSILVNLGLSQSFAPLLGIRKAGRPPGARDVCTRKKGFARKAEPTAAVKLRLGNEFLKRRKETGESSYSILKDMSRKYGCSIAFLRRVKKESVSNLKNLWLEEAWA